VPLQDRPISIGQSVLLQAMALGKPVIATRTPGTTDYIEHMVDGVLVRPGDASDLRRAMEMLASEALRRELGRNARQRVYGQLLPEHYAAAIRSSLCD
jgi:glycosyltransferase involved in cell wall biosynthesis